MINKVEILEITEKELPDFIYLSYESDEELMSKYHVKRFTILEAVEFEIELIKEKSTELAWKYFKILYAKIPIGYAVAFEDFIFSFCISINYRTKEVLQQWWEMMVYYFGQGIKFGLMDNNQRAINYFKKRGMKVSFETQDKKEVLLTF